MRSQSAVEFLTTYGWAFIILMIVLLALFETGFFNPGTYSAQQCVLTSGFGCLNFFLYSNGLLYVNLQQSLSAPINITALGCNSNAIIANMQAPYNPPSNQIFLPIGANYTFTIQCYSGSSTVIGNSTFSGALAVNYTNDLTHLPSTAVGKLTAKPT